MDGGGYIWVLDGAWVSEGDVWPPFLGHVPQGGEWLINGGWFLVRH